MSFTSLTFKAHCWRWLLWKRRVNVHFGASCCWFTPVFGVVPLLYSSDLAVVEWFWSDVGERRANACFSIFAPQIAEGWVVTLWWVALIALKSCVIISSLEKIIARFRFKWVFKPQHTIWVANQKSDFQIEFAKLASSTTFNLKD